MTKWAGHRDETRDGRYHPLRTARKQQYLAAYDSFLAFLQKQNNMPPEFMQTPEKFLQFLYDLNIICYIEHTADRPFFRWCFIERTPSNISPKVKTEMEYEIHYSLANALNTGKPIRGRRTKEREAPTHPLLDYARPNAEFPQPRTAGAAWKPSCDR